MTTDSNETRCHGLDRRCTLEDWRKPSGHPGPWECDRCGNERLIVGCWKGDQSLFEYTSGFGHIVCPAPNLERPE